jgi:hypothetical protein
VFTLQSRPAAAPRTWVVDQSRLFNELAGKRAGVRRMRTTPDKKRRARAWSAALQGSLVNTEVAESRLEDALHATGLDQFQSKSSGALEALLVAFGRKADASVLGGAHSRPRTSGFHGMPLPSPDARRRYRHRHTAS